MGTLFFGLIALGQGWAVPAVVYAALTAQEED